MDQTTAKNTPPWKKKRKNAPKKAKMTPEQIEMARERALKAGRRYPNLIDNMAIIKESKKLL